MWAYDQPDTLYATVHPASISKIGRFLLKPDTQLRVSPCFGSRTRPARPFPNPRIFPVRGNQLHPRAKQRSTFPRLSPQERQNYITSPRPVSTAPLAPVRGSGVGNKEHPTPLCLSVLPPHPKRVVPTHPQRVIPTTPLWVYRHTPCRYYRHTLRWYYRQPPRGYYRKRQRGREIARRRSWERYIDV